MRQTQPYFSIIIPTYNRPYELVSCLRAVARLSYPPECFEVIVVDDGSEISVEPILSSFPHQLEARLITQPHCGPAMARNRGAQQARGEFLAFTDDDCIPAPNWLQTLALRFDTAPKVMIGGQTLNLLPNNIYATTSHLLIDYLYRYYNPCPDDARFLTTNNLALPAKRFNFVDGFDTTFPLAGGEDREFCHRWRHQGYRMIYAQEVIVYHAHELRTYTFWRQHFNYGRGSFHFHRARAQRQLKYIRLEPLSFYVDLLRYPFSQVSVGRTLLLTAILTVSQVVHAAGFSWQMLNQITQGTDRGKGRPDHSRSYPHRKRGG